MCTFIDSRECIKTSTSSYASKGFHFCLKSCLISNASGYFLPTSICVLHSNFWYLHMNSLLEWRFYYFHMFRNPVNQFMQLNPFPAVKTFTWTGAERHAWRNRYWRSRGQIVYRRNRRNGARLLQRTLSCVHAYFPVLLICIKVMTVRVCALMDIIRLVSTWLIWSSKTEVPTDVRN